MKTALITGANKGIGFAIAKTLGAHDVHVILGVRSMERGQAAAEKLKQAGVEAVDLIEIDLSKPAILEAAIETVKSQYSDLDVLINNAGIPGPEVPNSELTVTDLQATYQVNFLGNYQLTMGLLPVLTKNHGQVVNITIPTNPNPMWNPLAYKSSKAALNVFTDSLSLDMKQNKQPVAVYGVHPGPTTTDLNGNMKVPGFHSPAKVAAKLLPILESGNTHNGEFIEIYKQISSGPLTQLAAKLIRRK